MTEMRIWVKSALLQLCIFFLVLAPNWALFGLTARDTILLLTPNFEERMRELEKVSPENICDRLGLHKKQKRMCRKGKGVAETLVRAARLAALECQHQFQDERWNCTMGNYRKNILEKGIKETSFLYAISSAALVNEVSRACAQGILDRCTCDESEDLDNTKTWRWGGCGDNIRFGLKFSKKFIGGGGGAEKDIRAKVDEHNTEAGTKAVKDLVHKICKCQGVSGSCAVRTCWLRLSPFPVVGRAIKTKYEKSAKVIDVTNQANGKTQLMKRRRALMEQTNSYENHDIVPIRTSDLTHIEDSPNFCRESRYSPGTVGRSCIKGKNCDSICCGRGYNVQKQKYKRACKCEVVWCCSLQCKYCIIEEEVYLCK
ncbi:unnamed protein product [Lymnaea stagnalis]|uniref:Protein Wnt n=1 Tax=Lymnaea stagnalis TaxID=6523 RepID=A0AAV2HSA0_LYMST